MYTNNTSCVKMVTRNRVIGGYSIMAKMYSKNSWALFLLILAGIVLGGFLGYLAKEVPYLNWLNYGQQFSIGTSDNSGIVRLNLGIIIIRFGLTIKITIASIVGVIAAIIVYRRL